MSEPPTSSSDPLLKDDPVGTGSYEVASGDCISSIAYEHGFFWKTLWEHPNNEALRTARGDGHILLPGDRVTVPPLVPRTEDCQTARRHRFKREGVPAKLRICVTVLRPSPETVSTDVQTQNNGTEVTIREPEAPTRWSREPLANKHWVLAVGGELTTGTTDDHGLVEAWISPGARSGRLTVDPGGGAERVMVFDLGALDPEDSSTGVAQRLRNLGFDAADPTNQASLATALEGFQHVKGIEKNGRADSRTRDALKETHGA
ncbi:MAG: peptidoglycan-binding protein [Phycisphaerales bacterium]|jgi:N-acetylmuramoyl-L-alanine amidase